mmetsp:Transcript_35812/g.82955  ORF Transcript_35812/g.82955 Transcript_35812/m.82955 type:complete len:336 (+) Transcript_35812:1410-2417(+)
MPRAADSLAVTRAVRRMVVCVARAEMGVAPPRPQVTATAGAAGGISTGRTCRNPSLLSLISPLMQRALPVKLPRGLLARPPRRLVRWGVSSGACGMRLSATSHHHANAHAAPLVADKPAKSNRSGAPRTLQRASSQARLLKPRSPNHQNPARAKAPPLYMHPASGRIHHAHRDLTAAVRRERGGHLNPIAILKHLADDLPHVELCPPIRLHIHLLYGDRNAELPPSLVRLLVIPSNPDVAKPLHPLRATAARHLYLLFVHLHVHHQDLFLLLHRSLLLLRHGLSRQSRSPSLVLVTAVSAQSFSVFLFSSSLLNPPLATLVQTGMTYSRRRDDKS